MSSAGAQIDGLHAALVAGFVPILGDHFAVDSALDASTWAKALVNGATLTGANNRLKTGTTANASAKLRTTRRARYIMGTIQSAQFSMILKDSLTTTNNARRWGLFDATDGWFFEQSGGVMQAGLRRSGSDTKVPATSWTRRFTPTLGTAHRYEIRATHLPSNVFGYEFFVDGELCYRRVDNTGPTSPQAIELPLSIENVNSSGGTGDVGLDVHGAIVGRYGMVRGDEVRSFDLGATAAQVKNKCGRLHRVIVGVAGADGDTVTLYNGTSGSDEVLLVVDTSLAREIECGFAFDQLYAEFSTDATGDVVVVFD